MATLETVDGRLLRRSQPGGGQRYGGLWPSAFPPMWSDGEREPNGLTDGTHLASYESLYRSQPVIAAVIDKLSRRIASLPFDAYRRLGDGARELVRGDTLDSLLSRPMPAASRLHMLHHIAQSLLLHGNALKAKVRGPDRDAPPIWLWPLDWSQVSAYAPAGGTIEWWSTSQFSEPGEPDRYLMASDVVHFAWAAPSGQQIGVSPLEKLGVTLRIEDAAQRHQTASFRNGHRPSLIISATEDLKPQTKEEMKAALRAFHEGPDKAGRTMFLSGGVNAEPISLSPVEVALIDQRKLNREEVGMVYDLAGPLMNDLTHGTYSNVAELTAGLYRDVVPPWLGLIEGTFDAQLLRPEPAWMDQFVAFDLTDKLKGDPTTLAQSLQTQVEAGLITRNEARRILNMAPMDDPAADQLSANTNNQAPISTMDTSPNAP